ncbi:MAG: PA domain-containing protein [Rhodothermales bacterium]
MTTVRYALLVFSTLAPALALAQGADTVNVEVAGATYGAWGANFGPRFPSGLVIGPDTLVHVAGTGETAPAEQGCDPLTNADDVAGNVAMVLRGTCTFVVKVQNAAAAGAVAVVVYNDDRNGNEDESLVQMGGDCDEEEGCTIRAVFISRASGLAILTELDFPKIVTLYSARLCEPTGNALSTGPVTTFLYSNGFVGAAPNVFCNSGFRFHGAEGGENGLAVASVLVGQASETDTTVTGSPYVSESEYEWGSLDFVAPPFAPPFENFDRALTASYASAQGVVASAYTREGDAFIVLDLGVTNTTDGDLAGIYVGLFADWEVGDAGQNLGGFDASTNLLYVYDDSGTSENYFGVAALDVDGVSGWTLATDEDATDPSLFAGLTMQGEALSEPQDARTVVGVGPFDLAPGDAVNARFAMLAGTGLSDIVASAAAAQAAVTVAAEDGVPEEAFALDAAYPNPSADRTTIPFTLPTAQRVRLAVYDVLGREVAVLVDGARPAGEQAVTFDASALLSGVYVARLEAGTVQLTQRVTVVR